MKRLLTLASALAMLAACETPPASGGPGEVPIGGDAGPGGSCVRPEEGCPCDDPPPMRCFLDPVERGGITMCREGTRYCRDGAWTACESIHEYALSSTAQALVTGPSECNPCDPSCAISTDTPDDTDLPGSSTNLLYDPVGGGIRLDDGAVTTVPMLPDSDGDGVPDVADDCVGPGAIMDPAGGCVTGTFFFHELPYGGAAEIDPLYIMVQVRTADVYFLMDTTGSMGGEIANLQSTLTSGTFIAGCGGGVIGAIRCTIPDAWFGVGRFDDYPYGSYGGATDVVYQHLQDIDASLTASQTAVNSMYASGGWDGPESQTQALYAVASGNGLGPYLPPRAGCPAGTWGYPCFRDGTIPIVIHITDAPMHNGPSGYNYSGVTGAVSYAQSVAALNANNVRVITIVSGTWATALSDANAVADATGSYDSSGARYVYNVSASGTGLDSSIVNAVVDLANFNRMDITARAVDNAATAIDETGFVASITAVGWGPGSCTGISGGDTFTQCLPGTSVDFNIAFRNDFVMPTMVPQVFDFTIEVVGDGTFVIQTIPVRIVVPPQVPQYPPRGEYWRDYDSTLYCAPNERPDWGDLSWVISDMPAGTQVQFEIRASDSLTSLPMETPVVINATTLTGTVDVGALLDAAGVPAGLPYLRVTAVLLANADQTATPTVQSFELVYNCIPTE